MNIFSIVRLRNKVLNTIVMMYGFGSKNEGLVFAKIEVNGLWLFLYRVEKDRSLSLGTERKTDESLTLLSQLSVYSHSGMNVIVLPPKKYKTSCLEHLPSL